MQELGSTLEQVMALGLLALAFALSWYMDKRYRAGITLPFIFPDESNTYQEAMESRKRNAKTWVRIWWGGALVQVSIITISGYLFLSVFGAVLFFGVSGLLKFAAGLLFFIKPHADSLAAFERRLEHTPAVIPLTDLRLRQEIERCIEDGLMQSEDYPRLLQYLSRRSDAIGTAARQLGGSSIGLA